MITFIFHTSILLTVLFFVPWFGNVTEESRLVLAFVAAVTGTLILHFIWDFLSAPSNINEAQMALIDELTTKITPKLSVRLANDGGPCDLPYGNTLASLTGRLQTTMTMPSHGYRAMICENVSSVTLDACEAHLSDVRFIRMIDGFTPKNNRSVPDNWNEPLVDPIRLHWAEDQDLPEKTDIPPRARRQLILFQERGESLNLFKETLPANYHHYFQPGNVYSASVICSAKNMAGLAVPITITWGDTLTVSIDDIDYPFSRRRLIL